MSNEANKPMEWWIERGSFVWHCAETKEALYGWTAGEGNPFHVIERSYATELEARVAELEIKLKTMKHDYWFIENLIERYSTNKEEALQSIFERVKFRKPLFKGVE